MFGIGEGAAGSILSQRTQERVRRLAVILTALVVAVFVTIPVYVMIAIAIQTPEATFRGGNVNLLPTAPTIENFMVLFTETATPRYFFNSLVVTLSSTLLSTAWRWQRATG